MEKKAKRAGRPTKAPVEGERVPLGLRVTADLKRKLDEAAAASGRSQSQEAELRLERSFERQGLLEEVLTLAYGPETAALAMKVGGGVKAIAVMRAMQGREKLKWRRIEVQMMKQLEELMNEGDT